MPTVFADTFTGTNGQVLSTRTPSIGTSWTALANGANATIQSNTLEINNATTAGSEYRAIGTTIIADGYVEADCWTPIVTIDQVNYVFRMRVQNSTNFYFAGFSPASWLPPALTIWSKVAGSDTLLGIFQSGFNPPRNQFNKVRFSCQGTSLTVNFNGVTVISITNSQFSTGSHAEFQANADASNSLCRMDNFVAFEGVPTLGKFRPYYAEST